MDQHFFRTHFDQRSSHQKSSITQLDPYNESAVKWLKKFLEEKEPLSNVFAPITYEHPLYFNLYNPEINSKFFLIEELNTIIVFDVSDEALRLFDIISPTIPPLETLCSYIPYAFNQIEFYFNPDSFNLSDIEIVLHNTGNKLMVRGSFEWENDFLMMPLTAEF
jgi:hypothetical protein